MSETTPDASAISAANKTFIRNVERGALLLMVASLAATHAFAGPGPMLYGVLVGSVLGLLNWRAVIWLAHKTTQGVQRSRMGYTILAGSKILILMTTIWLALTFLPISPFGFLIGLTNLIVAIVFTGFLQKPTTAAIPGQERGA